MELQTVEPRNPAEIWEPAEARELTYRLNYSLMGIIVFSDYVDGDNSVFPVKPPVYFLSA